MEVLWISLWEGFGYDICGCTGPSLLLDRCIIVNLFLEDLRDSLRNEINLTSGTIVGIR